MWLIRLINYKSCNYLDNFFFNRLTAPPLFKLPLNPPHLLPVTISEGSLLLIQQDLDVSGDPRLVIEEAAYSRCRNNTVHTEVDVPRYAVHEIIKVLPMRITEQLPVLLVQSSPAKLYRSPWASPHSPGGHRKRLDLGLIQGLQVDEVVVWSSKRRKGSGAVPSLTAVYSRSSVVFSLVGQSTNCLKVHSVAARVMLLKSPDNAMNASGCWVWSPTTMVWMTLLACTAEEECKQPEWLRVRSPSADNIAAD